MAILGKSLGWRKINNNLLMHEGDSKFPITALAANSNLRRKRSFD